MFIDYIIEKEPLVNKFISVPRDKGTVLCFITRPITVHERMAICKSQLETIAENPGNTRGPEQASGRYFADGLYQGLVRLHRRLDSRG